MSFFARVDSLGIVEDHIQRVQKLEDSQAIKLLARYKEIRSELRDRLDFVFDETFTAQQLRGVLVQVEAAIDAMNASLKTGMADSAKILAERGIQDQIEEIKAFQAEFRDAVVPINLNAQLIAEDTNNFLFNRHEASIDAYGQDILSNLAQTLTNESLMQTPYSTVIRKLGMFFKGEEWKLHRIARTELHSVYSLGKLNGMREVAESAIPDMMKALFHPMDARTGTDSEYAASLNLVRPLNEPFSYKWKKEVRMFMTPPDRPNDRSILIPYRPAWNN